MTTFPGRYMFSGLTGRLLGVRNTHRCNLNVGWASAGCSDVFWTLSGPFAQVLCSVGL